MKSRKKSQADAGSVTELGGKDTTPEGGAIAEKPPAPPSPPAEIPEEPEETKEEILKRAQKIAERDAMVDQFSAKEHEEIFKPAERPKKKTSVNKCKSCGSELKRYRHQKYGDVDICFNCKRGWTKE
jgi:hypothetical protein